ncbi:MAG: ATP-dependent Clp protease proteolytic subunit, partial [Bdellovibrionales bacterium]|nr:ATP-dependent Clp protease proteolytic subunit [Bdellovibrionales bacterium]
MKQMLRSPKTTATPASRILFRRLWLLFGVCSLVLGVLDLPLLAAPDRPIVEIVINGPISPATDDYLRTSVDRAVEADARLLLIRLNTPGGLLNSMQTMVETLLEAPLPTVVYVSPAGGGAISAGVFITMAANVAVMAPGTTIGAAHPVGGDGQDVQGDMRAKIENFTASLIKAIAEQRGRNVKWAEQAVRESVAITDQEAVKEGVVDFVAADLQKLIAE